MNITPITRQDRRPAGALRSVLGPVSRWIGRTQQAMSDRIHASGDVRALSRGWEITTAPGPAATRVSPTCRRPWRVRTTRARPRSCAWWRTPRRRSMPSLAALR